MLLFVSFLGLGKVVLVVVLIIILVGPLFRGKSVMWRPMPRENGKQPGGRHEDGFAPSNDYGSEYRLSAEGRKGS
jgi:hypothetical protein